MDVTALAIAILAALIGGGAVGLYRARAEKHKTVAETQHQRRETDALVVREAVSTAQGFAEIATSLVAPLQAQLDAAQGERSQLARDLSQQRADTATLRERMSSLETLERECREDRATLRRQLERTDDRSRP